MAGNGAEQKQVTLPTEFRSPPENGHSRYARLTARFAPNRTPTIARSLDASGWSRAISPNSVTTPWARVPS